jgi:hypothetical protein
MTLDLLQVIFPRKQRRNLPQHMEHKAAKEILSLVFASIHLFLPL